MENWEILRRKNEIGTSNRHLLLFVCTFRKNWIVFPSNLLDVIDRYQTTLEPTSLTSTSKSSIATITKGSLYYNRYDVESPNNNHRKTTIIITTERKCRLNDIHFNEIDYYIIFLYNPKRKSYNF